MAKKETSKTNKPARKNTRKSTAVPKDKTLTLSYHQADSPGATSAAGSFLQSLMETFGGVESLEVNGKITRIKPGQFVPEIEQLTTPRQTPP